MSEREELIEKMNFIEQHAREIFVRARVNGQVESRALADLSGHLAIAEAFRLVKEGRYVPRDVLIERMKERKPQ